MSNRLDIIKNRVTTEALLEKLKSDSPSESLEAGAKLVQSAKESGLNIRDYLRLAIDTKKGEFEGSDLNGYECALAYLNLPIKSDLDQGVLLEAAGQTFQTYPGTRALFPAVIDDLIQWKYRQDQIEQIEPLLANSRTISQAEMISTVVSDQAADYQFTQPISERSRVPFRSIKTSENTVKIWKHGSGLRYTYEFERRASIDLITPYAARIQREKEISKLTVAVALLTNGDAVQAAAPVVAQSTLKPAGGSTSVAGTINWECFLAWLVSRAKAGTPIDTVVGNWDMYLQWQMMFARPNINKGLTQSEVLQKAGVKAATSNPNFNFDVKFAVASPAAASTLIGFSRADTLEELVEAGSEIQESQRAIGTQEVEMVLTENTGYRLVFGDTRSILSLDAVV